MKPLRCLAACLALALAASAAAEGGFKDPLDVPAQSSALSAKSLLTAIARAGDRLVAVGQRGHILVSADAGKTWQQSKVPVSSDLTAVHFPTSTKGWAVGHDGVILASDDGGTTWKLQLDGRRANQSIVDDLARKPETEATKALLSEAKRNVEQGADKPFLDVWFADERTGYAVGAYNLIFHTVDGGATWAPWFDRTDNPKLLNLYAIRPAAGALFVAGEAGLLLKLDPAAQRFRAVEIPYAGSLFGVTGNEGNVLVFGLRGNAFRSEDAGRTWKKAEASLPASIVASASSGSAILLADASGRVSRTTDGGRSFEPVPVASGMLVAGIADAGQGQLALVGMRGVLVTPAQAR
ncbi:MAG: YCF48-related protein [Burkholderiales bacterium]